MLQGRYGVASWRRQARLEVYARFVDACHDFNTALLEAFTTNGTEAFEQKWADVLIRTRALQRVNIQPIHAW
jgi:hypothetical protein